MHISGNKKSVGADLVRNFIKCMTAAFFSDPTLTEVAEGLENFEGVETGCIHSDLFDNVTLICNVSKPEEVIPSLTVTWLHDGTVRPGVIQVLTGGATVTHTLRFDSSVADDSGNYTCVAELVIPESTTIMQNATVEIIFRSELKGFFNVVQWNLIITANYGPNISGYKYRRLFYRGANVSNHIT